MGASQRKEAVEYFQSLAEAADPPTDEAYAAKLGLYSAGLCSGSEFFAVARPVVARLLSGAERTGRLRWLLLHCGRVMASVAGSPLGANQVQLAALRVAELTMRHVLAAAKGDSARLLGWLEAQGEGEGAAKAPAAAAAESDAPGAALCLQLMQYVAQVSLDAATARTHAAVARLLLTLLSSALHHDTRFTETTIDVFTETIMSSEGLATFLSVLLDRTVAWGAGVAIRSEPPAYAEGCEPSLRNMIGLFGGAGSRAGGAAPQGSAATGRGGDSGAVKGLPPCFSVTGEARSAAKNVYASCEAGEVVLRHSTALLAVLVAHQKGNGRNPALDYVTALQSTEALSFTAILTSLSAKLGDSPATCMLLYVLLYDHPTFLHDALRADQDAITATMERVLMVTHLACTLADPVAAGTATKSLHGAAATAAAPSGATAVVVDEDPLSLESLGRIEWEMSQYAYPFINFMTSTLLLILSQDRVVNQLACDTTSRTELPPDGRRRRGAPMGPLPVSALALQVLSTGIIKAVNERNEPLAAVFAPCMANMAVFTHDMDTYTAQRVVALLLIMLRKIRLVSRAHEALERPQPAAVGGGNPLSGEDAKGLAVLGEMLLRQLRMVVEVVEGMLRGRDRRNEPLIYELLYERERIVGRASSGTGNNEQASGGAAEAQRSLSTSVVIEGDNTGLYAVPVREALANLSRLILGYEAEIASAPSAATPAEIIAIIRRCNQSSSGAAAVDSDGVAAVAATVPAEAAAGANLSGASPDLLYSYEESPQSYEFFGPFVWSALLSDGRWPGGILWCTAVPDLALFPH